MWIASVCPVGRVTLPLPRLDRTIVAEKCAVEVVGAEEKQGGGGAAH